MDDNDQLLPKLPVVLWLLATLTHLTSCASSSPPAIVLDRPPRERATLEQAIRSEDKSVLKGDTLSIWVKEDPSYDGAYTVLESGYIVFPKVGRIQLDGVSLKEAEARVKTALEGDQLTEATVILERTLRSPTIDPIALPAVVQAKLLVYMTGKVPKPGQHIIRLVEHRSMGVYEVILVTGGMHRFGNERKVEIIRSAHGKSQNRLSVDVRKIRKGKIPDIPVQNGDIINVGEKFLGF